MLISLRPKAILADINVSKEVFVTEVHAIQFNNINMLIVTSNKNVIAKKTRKHLFTLRKVTNLCVAYRLVDWVLIVFRKASRIHQLPNASLSTWLGHASAAVAQKYLNIFHWQQGKRVGCLGTKCASGRLKSHRRDTTHWRLVIPHNFSLWMLEKWSCVIR